MNSLPPEKEALLAKITARLSAVEGVQAVVLGGSYARGTACPSSDLDVALYYHPDAPFRIEDIRQVAAEISAQGVPDVTDFYGWGAWVNGGAWIHTAVCKVDFLYRNIAQVQQAIDDARRGVVHHDFNQQPAYGFYSVIYLAETRVCQPRYDPHGVIARLKEQVMVYPPLLKEKYAASCLWLAEFSLIHAADFAARGDVYATAGTLARTATNLTQALFALNETYFMTDKTAMQEIAAFPLCPADYPTRLNRILAHVGQTPEQLGESVRKLHALWCEVVALTGGAYRPAFRL